jgi:hypothetical protein
LQDLAWCPSRWQQRHRAGLEQSAATWSVRRQLKQRPTRSAGTGRRGGGGGRSALLHTLRRATTCHSPSSPPLADRGGGGDDADGAARRASAMKDDAATASREELDAEGAALDSGSTKGAFPLPRTTSTNETDGREPNGRAATGDLLSDDDGLKRSQLGSSSPAPPEDTSDREKAAASGFSTAWGRGEVGAAGGLDVEEGPAVVAGLLGGVGAWLGVIFELDATLCSLYLDARIVYETRIGKFDVPNVETLDPEIWQYSDLSSWIDEHTEKLREKSILMYVWLHFLN